jgi:hypothetical protein
MDAFLREAAIETITEYARIGGDEYLIDLVGFNSARTDVTNEMEAAAVVAVLPLLPDERLNFLMRHIAEMLVDAKSETKAKGAKKKPARRTKAVRS